MPAIGPYSRPTALTKIDGRTREARLLSTVRSGLLEHVGGSPSAVQRALIDQIARLQLHIAMMDRKAGGKSLSERDGRQYLAWCNSASRLLRQLGMKGAAAMPRTLADHVAAAPKASAP